MQLAFRLITTLVFIAFFTACQRPYALHQRTSGPQFGAEIRSGITPKIASADTIAETIITDIQPVVDESLEASAFVSLPASSFVPVLKPVQTTIHLSEIADQQPRPKARSNSDPPRKTFREWLGLKPRPQLNWWQRISWKIKASVLVILVAIVFAILNINTLAIIFGIIGAVLLVSGLRKTFKVRRPWF